MRVGREECGWLGGEDGRMISMVYGGVLGVRVMGACVCGCLGGLKGECKGGRVECKGGRMEVGRWSLGWRLELGGLW